MTEQYHEHEKNKENAEPKRSLGSIAVEKVLDVAKNLRNDRLIKQGGQWQTNDNGDWIVGPPRFDSDGIRDNTFDS
jgi:hypothetical protein